MRNSIVEVDLEEISKQKINFKKLSGKTVLVTGASGMIGGYLVESLLYFNETKKLKIKILALSRNGERLRKRYSEYKQRSDLTLIESDVVSFKSFTSKIDYFIHAASQASPKHFGDDPVGTLLPNVVGTQNLLEMANRNKSDCFLFVSSSEVYGTLKKDQIPTKENYWGPIDPTDPRSCYAESKRMGEAMCIAWHRQYGINIKIARPFHVYGPGMDLHDGRVFADFTKDIVEGKEIKLNSSGNAKRTFCYLSDAVAAIFILMTRGKNGEAYNIGNNKEEVSISELARMLIKIFPEKDLKLKIGSKIEKKSYIPSRINRSTPDTSKLKRLGWKPRVTITEGFRRTVLSFS